MPTPTKGARLGGSPAHEKQMLSNLATELFRHGAITTTETRAKRLRPVAERLITKAKKGTIAARRDVLKDLTDKGVVHELFEEIARRFAERPGGYTRITKIGPRKGDNAPMAVIELVTEEYSAQQETVVEAEAATRTAAPALDAEETAETETETETEAETGAAAPAEVTEEPAGTGTAAAPAEEPVDAANPVTAEDAETGEDAPATEGAAEGGSPDAR